MQETEPLGSEFHVHGTDPGDVTARPIEAGDETSLDWVPATANTIEIVVVAALAATAAAVLAGAAITATCRRIKSAAIAGKLSSGLLVVLRHKT